MSSICKATSRRGGAVNSGSDADESETTGIEQAGHRRLSVVEAGIVQVTPPTFGAD